MTKLSFTCAAAMSLAFASIAFAGPADDIIAKEKCLSCHTPPTKGAPSWASVAQRYKRDDGAEAKLAWFLKSGGIEDHKVIAASDADLRAVVAIVLSSR